MSNFNKALVAGAAALCVTALSIPQAANAALTTFTLSNVVFSDGGTASGFFIFDPEAQTFGNFDITTTAGTSNPSGPFLDTGYEYTPTTAEAKLAVPGNNQYSAFQGTTGQNLPNQYLGLFTPAPLQDTGTFDLYTGGMASASGFTGAGEFSPSGQFAATGSLVAGRAVVTPEPSTVAAMDFGAFGLLGMAFRSHKARKRA